MLWLNTANQNIKSILMDNHLTIEKHDGEMTVTGKITTMLGAVGTGAFFSAPVIIPLIIGGFIKSNVIRCLTTENTTREKCCILVLGILLGGGVGGTLGYYTWELLTDLVYDPQNALFAGYVGAGITGLGMTLWGIGCCLDARKITKITSSEVTPLV